MYKVDKSSQEIPTHSFANYEEQKKVDEKLFLEESKNSERKELINKVSTKLRSRLDSINCCFNDSKSVKSLSSVSNSEVDSSSNKDMFSRAKEFLEDNATKLK